jgi:hypothetical protein
MQKVMITLLPAILVWVFFMLYPFEGHEDFNSIKLIGMLMLCLGIYAYVELEMLDIQVQIYLSDYGSDEHRTLKIEGSNGYLRSVGSY